MFFYYLCKRNMSKITAKECQNVEYKRSWKDEYLKWICGFANAQGATIFFGVDDDLELHGLQNAKKLLEDKLVIVTGTWVWVPVFMAIFLLYS